MFSCFFAGIWTYNYKRMEWKGIGLDWNGTDWMDWNRGEMKGRSWNGLSNRAPQKKFKSCG